MYLGKAEEVLLSPIGKKLKNKVRLIFTSPPFPLNRKKKYGNEVGEQYIEWLSNYAPLFGELLKKDGSIVIEVGNAWEPGIPIMSTLALKALLKFLERGELYLCQQFVIYNPAKLPTPAQWVNVERIRLKDAFTYVWWMGKTPKPFADNKNVLREYSESMKRLLKTKKYNFGKRPSEHVIGEKSFLKNNKGSIPSNVLTFTNTKSSDSYIKYCKVKNIPLHPARMPIDLPEFFIRFLTKPKELILDPFAGSNTTGAAAEKLKRRWISIEPENEYVLGSYGRFQKLKR